ncbi:aldose 1-epimerase family protein [Stomatobaculum longum]|uniref:aldose 1-epimerase family protein n=1 Tax=Stomatobaculum longum TaxID=796942 RepID=UPI0028EA265C|nr:aldose 1-epimerase family protein [Stomatobaculum longum]
MNSYIGHDSQLYGVEELRLIGGKGDGMRLYQIHNGKGLDLIVSPDRNGDITRLRYKGMNMSYLSPSGYVAPAYYDSVGTNWLSSFTAGFLTTCGLNNVGTPNTDQGEVLPLHGSIANLPADYSYWAIEESENGTCLVVHSETKDETLFGRKLRLTREIKVSTDQNEFCIRDTIVNTGDKIEPYEILYHMNMGYPLLDEDSVIEILSAEVLPRNEHAASELAKWMHMQRPTAGYEECCYYHKFADKEGRAKIYQPKLGISLEICFDAEKLDGFVEWKMMGIRDYVLGLECGNCYPDGRDVMRKERMLKFLGPGESQEYEVRIRLKDE